MIWSRFEKFFEFYFVSSIISRMEVCWPRNVVCRYLEWLRKDSYEYMTTNNYQGKFAYLLLLIACWHIVFPSLFLSSTDKWGDNLLRQFEYCFYQSLKRTLTLLIFIFSGGFDGYIAIEKGNDEQKLIMTTMIEIISQVSGIPMKNSAHPHFIL